MLNLDLQLLHIIRISRRGKKKEKIATSPYHQIELNIYSGIHQVIIEKVYT
jgi:hypothetical protein